MRVFFILILFTLRFSISEAHEKFLNHWIEQNAIPPSWILTDPKTLASEETEKENLSPKVLANLTLEQTDSFENTKLVGNLSFIASAAITEPMPLIPDRWIFLNPVLTGLHQDSSSPFWFVLPGKEKMDFLFSMDEPFLSPPVPMKIKISHSKAFQLFFATSKVLDGSSCDFFQDQNSDLFLKSNQELSKKHTMDLHIPPATCLKISFFEETQPAKTQENPAESTKKESVPPFLTTTKVYASIQPRYFLDLQSHQVELDAKISLEPVFGAIHFMDFTLEPGFRLDLLQFQPTIPFRIDKKGLYFPGGIQSSTLMSLKGAWPVSSSQIHLKLPAFKNDQIFRDGTLYIISTANVELKSLNMQNSRELPYHPDPELHRSSEPLLSTREFFSANTELSMEVLHPSKVIQEEMVIHSASMNTLVFGKEQIASLLELDIKNRSQREFRFPLPMDATLLGATVNGKNTKSYRSEKGELILHLPPPQKNEIQSLNLSLRWLENSSPQKIRPWFPNIFPMNTNWRIYYPAEYKLENIQSNLVYEQKKKTNLPAREILYKAGIEIKPVLLSFLFTICTVYAFFLFLRGLFSLFHKEKRKRVLSMFFVFFIAIVLFMLSTTPNFRQARSQSNPRVCFANMKTLLGALEMYTLDTNKTMTIQNERDLQSLVDQGYLSSVLQCPEGGAHSYHSDSAGNVWCSIHGPIDGHCKDGGDPRCSGAMQKSIEKEESYRLETSRYQKRSRSLPSSAEIAQGLNLVMESDSSIQDQMAPASKPRRDKSEAKKKEKFKEITRSGIKPVEVNFPKLDAFLDFSLPWPTIQNLWIEAELNPKGKGHPGFFFLSLFLFIISLYGLWIDSALIFTIPLALFGMIGLENQLHTLVLTNFPLILILIFSILFLKTIQRLPILFILVFIHSQASSLEIQENQKQNWIQEQILNAYDAMRQEVPQKITKTKVATAKRKYNHFLAAQKSLQNHAPAELKTWEQPKQSYQLNEFHKKESKWIEIYKIFDSATRTVISSEVLIKQPLPITKNAQRLREVKIKTQSIHATILPEKNMIQLKYLLEIPQAESGDLLLKAPSFFQIESADNAGEPVFLKSGKSQKGIFWHLLTPSFGMIMIQAAIPLYSQGYKTWQTLIPCAKSPVNQLILEDDQELFVQIPASLQEKNRFFFPGSEDGLLVKILPNRPAQRKKIPSSPQITEISKEPQFKGTTKIEASLSHWILSHFLSFEEVDLFSIPLTKEEKIISLDFQDPKLQPGKNIWIQKNENGIVIQLDKPHPIQISLKTILDIQKSSFYPPFSLAEFEKNQWEIQLLQKEDQEFKMNIPEDLKSSQTNRFDSSRFIYKFNSIRKSLQNPEIFLGFELKESINPGHIRCDLMQVESWLNDKETLVTKITLALSNQNFQFLEMQLPEKTKILTALRNSTHLEVAHKPNQMNTILLPLIGSHKPRDIFHLHLYLQSPIDQDHPSLLIPRPLTDVRNLNILFHSNLPLEFSPSNSIELFENISTLTPLPQATIGLENKGGLHYSYPKTTYLWTGKRAGFEEEIRLDFNFIPQTKSDSPDKEFPWWALYLIGVALLFHFYPLLPKPGMIFGIIFALLLIFAPEELILPSFVLYFSRLLYLALDSMKKENPPRS